MKKQISIKIPKGTACKNGVECGQDLELDTEIDIPELKPIMQINPSAELQLIPPQQILERNNGSAAPLEPKTIEKPVPPSYQPSYKCKDGKCGQNHVNPNYTTTIKGKCDNCGQYGPDNSGPCFWCQDGNFEEVEPEELEDLGILPPEPLKHLHEE